MVSVLGKVWTDRTVYYESGDATATETKEYVA